MSPRSDDPMLRQLQFLRPAALDDTHTAAVRARCHAVLARQRRPKPEHGVARPPQRYVALASAGACALTYVIFVIRDALAMYGLFQLP